MFTRSSKRIFNPSPYTGVVVNSVGLTKYGNNMVVNIKTHIISYSLDESTPLQKCRYIT